MNYCFQDTFTKFGCICEIHSPRVARRSSFPRIRSGALWRWRRWSRSRGLLDLCAACHLPRHAEISSRHPLSLFLPIAQKCDKRGLLTLLLLPGNSLEDRWQWHGILYYRTCDGMASYSLNRTRSDVTSGHLWHRGWKSSISLAELTASFDILGMHHF